MTASPSRGTCEEGETILRNMPDNSPSYRSSAVATYRRWVQALTLTQFILFIAVVNFVAAVIVGAAISAISGPFSWPWVIVWTVLMTAFLTWWRQGGLS